MENSQETRSNNCNNQATSVFICNNTRIQPQHSHFPYFAHILREHLLVKSRACAHPPNVLLDIELIYAYILSHHWLNKKMSFLVALHRILKWLAVWRTLSFFYILNILVYLKIFILVNCQCNIFNFRFNFKFMFFHQIFIFYFISALFQVLTIF